MSVEASVGDLVKVVALLGAAVVAVPIFRKIGLGSVLGYLAAGLAIGPFGLAWFTDSAAILHVAELGVVMFLFVIGLEMRPSHLWSLRNEIFGLGSFQIAVCTLALTLVGVAFGFPLNVSFICGMGFVLTSTAIVMQLMSERGETNLPHGQKIVSVLLFEDLLIVPLLAIVAFMSPNVVSHEGLQWMPFLIAIGAVAGLIVAGIWLLNPLFRLLALAKAREVLTAAALLVVLGSALIMQISGLSMAMGAFLAGVLLAESTFRHQIEADIEPFRGILLGLFFIGVGMSLNLSVVIVNWSLILSGVLAMMLAKAICIYMVARISKSSHKEALDRAIIMAQGGEFAFVLYAAATAAGVIDATVNANITAIVVLSMVLTPLFMILYKKLSTKPKESMDGIEEANGLTGNVLIIGFGRFGQVMSQLLLARNTDVTIIDNDIEMIRSASNFGFKIYYGDARRLDVLRASGAHTAAVIAVCVDDKDAANKVVELAKAEFSQAKILVRAYDRTHARELMVAKVDFQMRETFESAIKFGMAALCKIGVEKEEANEIAEEIRRRDTERFELELVGGAEAGRKLLLGNASTPVPFTKPQRESKPLTQETAVEVQSQVTSN
ncbi:MAG: monovalent cation:proton antiporter-2 (CPA2) family protein [Bdellovibrionota bacterium]